MRMHRCLSTFAQTAWRASAGCWLAALCIPSLAAAQEVPAAAPAGSAPVYRLQDCLSIAWQKQPALQAAAASMSAAQTGQRGLHEIRFGRIFAKDLPVRKQQAAWGVNAAAANLMQVGYDTNCAVARTYYSVIYAREQKKVAEEVVTRLKITVANGETLLGKEGAPDDLTPLAVEKAKLYLAMAETELAKANRGLQRAAAALKEAIGLEPECDFLVADDKLPAPHSGVDKNTIIALAVSRRGEIIQAQSAACITCLEVTAQSRLRGVRRPTAASGGDMHARPIPTGSFGDDYKPGAIGLDFPTLFVGPKATRVQRAQELAVRAQSASDKARNLVALDAEDAWLRWEESTSNIGKLKKAAADAEAIARKSQSALESGVIQSYRDVLEMHVLAAQVKAKFNESMYQHMIALTELERATAGGFPAGITVMPAAQP